MASLGYTFQHKKLDAQHYLLPQRRNRVYALADVKSGRAPLDLQSAMGQTLTDLASDVSLAEHVFDVSLPKESPRSASGAQVVEKAKRGSCAPCR